MTFPIKHKTEQQAMREAFMISARSLYFVYVFFNTAGYYVVDTLGIRYSDEFRIGTFYKGEKQ